MARLIVMRGLPGCGKSTQARQWVLEDPEGRAEVNRDAIRMMLGGYFIGSPAQEKQVTKIQQDAIRGLLRAGIDVVDSNTNLRSSYVKDLFKIAEQTGADTQVWDMTNIDLNVVRVRNAGRAAMVPDDVVMSMYNRYVKGKGYPLPVPEVHSADRTPDFVAYDPELPDAVIFDIDGTLAKMNGRSPYDLSRVEEDLPRPGVIRAARDASDAGAVVIIMSGRDDTLECYSATCRWLTKYMPCPFIGPFMRPPADKRDDAIVKRQLFDNLVRGRYNVLRVYDDRDRVVRMWREELGLTCMQVDYGDF